MRRVQERAHLLTNIDITTLPALVVQLASVAQAQIATFFVSKEW